MSKMNKKTIPLLGKLSSVVLFSLIVMNGCYYDNKEDLYANLDNSCETTSVTYSGTIVAIMNQNCATSNCHDATTKSANLDFSTYSDVETAAANGTLAGRINGIGGSLMPLGGNALAACQISQIEAWVTDGALNN